MALNGYEILSRIFDDLLKIWPAIDVGNQEKIERIMHDYIELFRNQTRDDALTEELIELIDRYKNAVTSSKKAALTLRDEIQYDIERLAIKVKEKQVYE